MAHASWLQAHIVTVELRSRWMKLCHVRNRLPAPPPVSSALSTLHVISHIVPGLMPRRRAAVHVAAE